MGVYPEVPGTWGQNINKTSSMVHGVLDRGGGIDCKSRAPIAMINECVSMRSGYGSQPWERKAEAS